jgi:hypothetical protein
VAEPLKLGHSPVDSLGPPLRERGPVVARGDTVRGKASQLGTDLLQAEPHPLCEDDEGESPEHVSRKPPVPRGHPLGVDERSRQRC